MTLVEPIKITCPECELPIEGKHFGSINVEIDPELKIKLLNGEINKFSCTNCDFFVYAPLPLLYNDHNLNIMIGCFPSEDISIWPEYELDEIASNKELKGKFGHLFGNRGIHNSRIVFGYDYLIEKIKIFDWDLNDLAIAINKMHLVPEDQRGNPPKIYLDSVDFEKQMFSYLIISAEEKSEILAPMDFYQEIVQGLNSEGTTTRDFVFIDYRRFVGPQAEDQESIQNQFIKYRSLRRRGKKR